MGVRAFLKTKPSFSLGGVQVSIKKCDNGVGCQKRQNSVRYFMDSPLHNIFHCMLVPEAYTTREPTRHSAYIDTYSLTQAVQIPKRN